MSGEPEDPIKRLADLGASMDERSSALVTRNGSLPGPDTVTSIDDAMAAAGLPSSLAPSSAPPSTPPSGHSKKFKSALDEIKNLLEKKQNPDTKALMNLVTSHMSEKKMSDVVKPFVVAYVILDYVATLTEKEVNARQWFMKFAVDQLKEGNTKLGEELMSGGKTHKSKSKHVAKKGGESYPMGLINNTDGLITAANDPLATASANVPSLLNTASPITSGLNVKGMDNTVTIPKGIVQSILPNLGGRQAGGKASKSKPKRK